MSSGIINTGSKPRLLLPGITELFGLNYDELKAVHPLVYNKQSSERNYEEAVQLVGVGQAEKKGEGEAVGVDSYKQGYARRTQHEVWAKKIRITMEAFDDDLYLKQAQVLSKELAKGLFHAKETNAASLFNNATSTNAPFLGADGVALLANNHPLGIGGTFSNISTSDLSELALEDAMIAMAGWVDPAGLLQDSDVRCLLIPRQNRYIAHRILKSELRPGTADNDANALYDRMDIPKTLEWRFLTDVDSWFLVTDVDGFVYYDRQAATPHHYEDDETMDQLYMMYERYSFDHYDPRCVYGSLGA